MSKISDNTKQGKIERRHKKIRSLISGTAERPRLSVFKSHRHIFVQLIDDVKGATLVSVWSKNMPTASKMPQAQAAKEVGAEIAKQGRAKGIKEVVFDRGGYLYAGKIKAVADSARAAGLKF